jgi:hypothetical protein
MNKMHKYIAAPPTAVEPPPPSKQVSLGETFELRCRAVGTPVPHINWRKNWGPVCPPPRLLLPIQLMIVNINICSCTQTSEGGLGILVIKGAQDIDAGAYTCEAINVNARILVVPDCIVTVGGGGNCNPMGSVSTQPGPDGRCVCKVYILAEQLCMYSCTIYRNGQLDHCAINV